MVPNTLETSRIPVDTFNLFRQAESIYREYLLEISVIKDISAYEKDRIRNNLSVIKKMVCEHLHSITDLDALAQLYCYLERNKQFFWSGFVLNVYCYNTAKPEVWETIQEGISENKSNKVIANSLLGFNFRYYNVCRYLVANYNRKMGAPDTDNMQNKRIIPKQSYVQLSLF